VSTVQQLDRENLDPLGYSPVGSVAKRRQQIATVFYAMLDSYLFTTD